MSIATTGEFGPGLTDFLSGLTVEPGGTSVTFGSRTVRGESVGEVRNELASALYAELHAGIRNDAGGSRAPGRDVDFEALLIAGVPHATSPVEAVLSPNPGPGPGPDPGPDEVLVDVGRTRVRVAAGAILEGPRDDGHVLLAVPAVRPMLSPGFLLVTSSTPAAPDQGPVLRLYAHVADAASAPSAWSSVIGALEDRKAPYRAKVLSVPDSYPRRDGIVVYLPEASWRHAGEVAGVMAAVPGLDPVTSPLTTRLAPGVGMAWEPADQRTGWKRMSFGQHRTAALAEGILRHLAGAPVLEEAIAEALTEASIDPREPARNLDSPEFVVEARP
ncbi:hypothetical protein GCM10009839_52240 [Catenulispora yoronensis]|uniref:Uncharacterized protein n=1 Tax=Catenulispora yoronensis TaxID=450799 RepID=A0ABN2USE0_9ACTN